MQIGLNKNKKGQTGGLITGLIFGVASLVIAAIIAFVIVSTLTDGELLTSGRTTHTVINESGRINSTGYTLGGVTKGANVSYVPGSFSIILAINGTNPGQKIASGNYSVSDDGYVLNASAKNWPKANITYTYSIKSTEERSSEALSANFTEGVDNISSKIPTVLLVAAIVLILGVLAILVGVWQRMRMGQEGI